MKKHFQQQFSEPDNVEYWDNIYDQHDFSGECYRQRLSIVLNWLGELDLSENSMVLDAGCGAGKFASEAAKRGYNVFGMDYSYGMTVKAKSIYNHEVNQNTAFIQGDIESLPFENSTFNVIICLGVVAYLKSEKQSLHELSRILKPNGILAISIVNKARLANRLDLPVLIANLLKKILNDLSAIWKKAHDSTDTDSLTTYLIPKFSNSLKLAGFTVLEKRTVPWKLVTFFGNEILPNKIARKITLFFEQFSNIPYIDSFGGMCVFKAAKDSN